MRIPVNSNKESIVLALTLQSTNGPADLRIRVADAYRPNTSFTDRIGKLDGTQTFYVRMPRTSKMILADIFNPAQPDALLPNDTFKLIDKQVLDISTFPREYASGDPLVKEAIEFIEDFSMRAGTLSAGPTGSVYMSDKGHFRIDYLDAIVDRQREIPYSPEEPDRMVPNPNLGMELSTPARISQDRGVIEVSKRAFMALTVPQRVAILLHEVSHFYFNTTQEDEEEADLNALKMFLGSGYGYIDANDAFLSVFKKTPTDENRARYDLLNDFIIDFEERNNQYR